jgi:predicted transcriptional regulator
MDSKRRGRPPRRPGQRPTEAELEILKVLWRRGPSTVREVHEVLIKSRPLVYTTVLKTMQTMASKGILERNEGDRAHVYRSALPAGETQDALADDLLDRVFGGSVAEFVLSVLPRRRASASELARIREVLDKRGKGGT